MDLTTYLARLREKYDITELGFMPESNEVPELSFEARPWHEMAIVLHRCERSDVRDRIMRLPEIPADYIDKADTDVLKKLYAIITVLVNSYVWSNTEEPVKILPSLLSVP